MPSLDQCAFSFRPVSYTANETKTLFTVRDAYFRVTSCDVRIETGFTGGVPALSVGVVADVDNLVETTDVTVATPGVYKGTGLGLDAGGGALYAPGTAINVTYTADASATQGRARIAITGHTVGV